ncbi:phenmedipham hydrolase-like [Rhipicephalus sanguineus]|uniref:phenmedipham hydrolase-like n=1 Tax=Rhipicephalus sanguineus TaxID=34632 RepID=UPI0020C56475|nr:phenmedipham hydrolase-like [Rhipicephalus sanguineus]
MDTTEKQTSEKISTSPSSRRSSRSAGSKRRGDASISSKARSKDKRSRERSEIDSKVDTDKSGSSFSTTETHKHKSRKGKRKNKEKMDDAFGTSSTAGVTSAATFPEFSPGPNLTITPTPAIDVESVNTTVGKLKGASVDLYGVKLHRWLGVPYSQLGVRSKRFAFAQPVKASSRIALDATEPSPPCAQVINDTLLGREDCLRVNVWAPAQDSANGAKRPLLLAMTQDWFSKGTNNLLEWERLAAKADAVVVSPNVRLGVLGYLGRTSPAELGADLAIKDAVVAVRWALDNAAAFHADPSKLMLVGHGSGAYVLTAAAQALKLNCLRAVLEGPVPGSVLPTNTDTVDTWEKLATVLGCRGNSESEWESCFEDAELSDLLAATARATYPFAPRWNPSEWPAKPVSIQVQEVVTGVDVDEVRNSLESLRIVQEMTRRRRAT